MALRLIAWVVIVAQLLVPYADNLFAAADTLAQNLRPPTADSPTTKTTAATVEQTFSPNRGVPNVRPPSIRLAFSEQPTDHEFFRARVFAEPLVPVGATTSGENKALAAALMAFSQRTKHDDVSAVSSFLAQNPQSTWRASLLYNLGILYRRGGYFTKALAAWEEAWVLAKTATQPYARAMADGAIGELAELNARLGRFDRLDTIFQEVQGRDIRGGATEKITGAREGLWLMRNQPEKAFRCGPLALDRILASANSQDAAHQKIFNSRSTTNGTSLFEVCGLANELKMNLQMAKRQPGAKVIVPSVVHWKAGHYAAITKHQNGEYLVQDPTFGSDIWITQAALDDEASGYCLILVQKLPNGWQHMSKTEGEKIWGKGTTGTSDPDRTKPCDEKVPPCENCCEEDPTTPMAHHAFHAMLVSLNIVDTPVGYAPSRGRPVYFAVTYNQREANQPQTGFTYSNLGLKWTFNWLSYITDSTTNSIRYYYVAGGGTAVYEVYDSTNQIYSTKDEDRSQLIQTSTNSYERRLANGSKQVFALSDGGSTQRKIFLTQVMDAAGNAVTLNYDSNLRITNIVDAIGLATTFSYGSTNPTDNLYYKITKVTDPFGRFATFDYNGSYQLTKITDVIGVTSEFTYGTGDFITSLTTPYGTTSFTYGETGTGTGRTRWLEAVDPLGQKERLEYQDGAPTITSDPAGAPAGWDNNHMGNRNSFYWDKKAMIYYPDVSQARNYHWLHSADGTKAIGILESEKEPLENRVWYAYLAQSITYLAGTNGLPSKKARLLDTGLGTQITQFEYNSIGNVTNVIDPTNRTTPLYLQHQSGGPAGSAPEGRDEFGTALQLHLQRAAPAADGGGCSGADQSFRLQSLWAAYRHHQRAQ